MTLNSKDSDSIPEFTSLSNDIFSINPTSNAYIGIHLIQVALVNSNNDKYACIF